MERREKIVVGRRFGRDVIMEVTVGDPRDPKPEDEKKKEDEEEEEEEEEKPAS
jgi:hypothetical protein